MPMSPAGDDLFLDFQVKFVYFMKPCRWTARVPTLASKDYYYYCRSDAVWLCRMRSLLDKVFTFFFYFILFFFFFYYYFFFFNVCMYVCVSHEKSP